MVRALALIGLLAAVLIVAAPAGARPHAEKAAVSHGKCVASKPKRAESRLREKKRKRCPRPGRGTSEEGSSSPSTGGGGANPTSGTAAEPKPTTAPTTTAPPASGPAPTGGPGSPAPPTEPLPPSEPAPPTEPEPAPQSGALAQGEGFAGAPADVFLSPAAGVDLSQAASCTAIGPLGTKSPFGGIEAGPTAGSVRLQLVPGGAMPNEVRCPTASGTRAFEVAAAAPTSGGVVSDPIDPKYLTELPFGSRSFWIQPWRSYLDTWPASRLLEAVGINFNVTTAEAPSTARLLGQSGFKLARVEIGWNQISYADPAHFVEEASQRQRLVALRENGLRPLILLNSNSGEPAPLQPQTLTTTAPAAAGSRTVLLDPASAAAVVPGRTGFAGLSFGGDPDVFITAVAGDGRAALSRPLPAELAAGPHHGATLRFGPFGPPRLANGEPNPEFERTLAGWLEYVGTVNRLAAEVFGPGEYDFEVWNELTFASEFLEESNYYSPSRVAGSGSVTQAILEATVAYLRDPANGVSPAVGISDGFASQTPFASAGALPAGTTALSKHLYRSPLYFPRNATLDGVRPLSALGVSDATGKSSPFTPRFTPNFGAAFPEYFLTGIQTESLVRDLSPNANSIYGVLHGRNAATPSGEPAQVWMTEYNLNTKTLFPLATGNQDQYIGKTTEAQEERLQAEIVLRSLVAMAGKGLAREYFYAAAHNPGYDLVSEGFMNAVDANPGAYPAGQSGGDTMTALPRMLSRFAGPGPGAGSRRLRLLSIAQAGNQAVWQGDGTAGHPDLFDRELLAVLPFQSAPSRFVIPIYVMTPNLTTVWDPSVPASSPTRFDLPDQRFRITLGNLPESAEPPTVSAYDPLRNEATQARLVSRAGDRAVFEIAATNYPRILTLDYGS